MRIEKKKLYKYQHRRLPPLRTRLPPAAGDPSPDPALLLPPAITALSSLLPSKKKSIRFILVGYVDGGASIFLAPGRRLP